MSQVCLCRNPEVVRTHADPHCSRCGHWWMPDAGSFMPGEAEAMQQVLAQRLPGTETIGRNEPCPCRSGKKFKRCCGGAK